MTGWIKEVKLMDFQILDNFILLKSQVFIMDKIIDALSKDNIVLLCGVAGTGKTTLCKYMINKGLFNSISQKTIYLNYHFNKLQDYEEYLNENKANASTLFIIDDYEDQIEDIKILKNISEKHKVLLVSRSDKLYSDHVTIVMRTMTDDDAKIFILKNSSITDIEIINKIADLAENNPVWIKLLINLSNNQIDIFTLISSIRNNADDLSLGKSTVNTILQLYLLTANKSNLERKYVDAKDWYERALDLARNSNLVNYIISISISLADLSSSLGSYDIAKSYLTNALNYASEHEVIALIYNNLGQIEQSVNNYMAAMNYYENALHESKSDLTSLTASIYNNIGSLYKDKDYNLALDYYKKALNIKISVLGESNSQVALSYNNIAGIYRSIQNYEEALNYYNKAIDILKSSLEAKNDLMNTIIYNMEKVTEEKSKKFPRH